MSQTEETIQECIALMREMQPWERQAVIELVRDAVAGTRRDAEWLIDRTEQLRAEVQL